MTPLLAMRGVSKSFAGVQALRDVNFTVEPGQIHALVGENGAGKSTLMKVLSGVYPHGSYEGTIAFDGEIRRFRDINASEALGIIIIHQELALIPLLSIAENIFLSHPPARFGMIDRDAVYRRTAELLAQVGLNERPDTLGTDLGIGQQQLVEIAKALSKRVRRLTAVRSMTPKRAGGLAMKMFSAIDNSGISASSWWMMMMPSFSLSAMPLKRRSSPSKWISPA